MENHPHPPCPHCRGPIVQRPDERSRAYLRRHYCSYQCERGARSQRRIAANMARTVEPVLIADEDKGQRGL